MTEFFETHAHLTDERYLDDIDAVLHRAFTAGVTRMILASADEAESLRAIELARRSDEETPRLWCMVGVHPHAASEYTDATHAMLRGLLRERKKNRIVALGEIGLDYHYDLSPREVQRDVFVRQMELAFEMDVPIVLHEREAVEDSLSILRKLCSAGRLRAVPGVCHCFSGSEETAQILLQMGFYLGFDGPITFKNSRKAPDVIRSTPLDRLLVETDSPYLTPEPFRGKRNEPTYISYIVAKMAEIKAITVEEAARATLANACRLFETDP